MNSFYFGEVFKISPQQQERPRFRRIGKNVKTYDPKNTKKFKNNMKQLAKNRMEILKLEATYLPIEVTFEFYVPMPKSYPKWKRVVIEDKNNEYSDAGIYYDNITKPDLSNYIKALEDALNGVIWVDDAQIIKLTAYKRYTAGNNGFIGVNVISHGDNPKTRKEVGDLLK